MLALLFLESAIMIMLYMALFFVIAQRKKDTTVVDTAWGSGFALIALFTLYKAHDYGIRHCIVTGMVILWALRLVIHLYMRNKRTGEDPRYIQLRKEWAPHFFIQSFFKIFMLQGFLLLLIATSIIVINASMSTHLNALDIIGIIIWIVGFIFETVGDYQLKQFTLNSYNHGKIMDSGLWHYTRHPNYFGEVVMWWGIFIIALSVPCWYISLISPVTITWLLLCVSGIPMTEKMFDGNQAYQAYKKRTSAFIPWFPKKG